jgi:bacterioferritin
MKGNEKVIAALDARLADELTAINQYMVHAEMCENWGYGRLHGVIEKRAIAEMKHAEKLIERILFLEGKPTVSKLNKISIGDNVEKQLKNDWKAEEAAIKDYNADIRWPATPGTTARAS